MSLFLLTYCSLLNEGENKNRLDYDQDFISSMFRLAEIKQQKILSDNENTELFPEYIDKEKTHFVNSKNWTSGFYPGINWVLYKATSNNKWRSTAQLWTESLFSIRHLNTTHDLGFIMLPSLYQGFNITQSDTYKQYTIEAANTLLTRFNKQIQLFKSWDGTRWEYPVIIDSIVNMELMFVATLLSKEPKYSQAAINHIENITKTHLRADGSVRHVVDIDPQTGVIIEVASGQGLFPSSTWSRGQAWAILGYALAYKYTSNAQYMALMDQVLSFYINNLPEDGMPLWDFEVSGDEKYSKDSSAGFITIYALLEMSVSVNNLEKKEMYRNIAFNLLKKAYQNGYINKNENYKGLTMHSIGHKPRSKQINVTLLYADYYFLRSLLLIKQNYFDEFNDFFHV